MKRRFILRAKRMAREAGFHDAKKVSEWNGYIVFEPFFDDEIMRYIGYPQFILLKSEKMRWTKNNKESLLILDSIKEG